MRKIVLAVLVILAVSFVIFSFADLQNVLVTLRKSNPSFLIAAFVLEIICLYNTAATMTSLYRLVGMREDRWQMFLMATSANFVNIVAPSGGLAGIAVFIDSAKKRNLSTARVMVVGVLYTLYEYISLIVMVGLGFIVLIRRNNLNPGEMIAAGLLFLIAVGDGIVLYMGYRSTERLGRLLAWFSRQINRLLHPFLHRDYLKVENAYQFSDEVSEGIQTIRGSHKNLIWPLLFTLNNKALLISILALTFFALDTPFTMGTLVGGFSISYLFFYISPTPAGIGFVEGILPVALNTLRVPITQAVLITMAFRGVTFWFPLLIGGLAFRLLQKRLQKQGFADPPKPPNDLP